ncbi:uncharacterized protein METZ01_LOCUS30632 [marine metagenome]|uniref:Uncharacterized protein n=1 Tax=marine metagenome TaxID=408172 RepID=A0A381QFK8_9ZZZZ
MAEHLIINKNRRLQKAEDFSVH